MAALIEVFLPEGGQSLPSSLPARLYDNGDYENTPVRITGDQFDSRSGTWTDTDTRIESTTEGSIVTYEATCQSYGAYREDGGVDVVEISIDGGAYASLVFGHGGRTIPAGRGLHTISIRIPAGGNVRIDEFWAV